MWRRLLSGQRALPALGAVLAAGLMLAATGGPQRQTTRRGNRYDPTWIYDGSFVFCRLAFSQSFDGDGGGWGVDYPRADLNFPFRLGELTEVPISRDVRGEPNHVIVTLDDPHLFECPFVMMTEPGGAYFSDSEAARLREYIDKGGFLWADDFWGEYAWRVFEREIRKALPAGPYPIVDLGPDHLLFNLLYKLPKVPQIPSINYWFATGQTSERYDSATPHVRAIEDEDGRVKVLITHNTDIGDSWEREGEDRRYFDQFSTEGYAFGVNVYLYAMTH